MSLLSKKRYQELVDLVHNVVGESNDKADQLIQGIKDIMNFDPDKPYKYYKGYTPELGQKTIARRQKIKEEQGISTYVTSGRKKYYETHKK